VAAVALLAMMKLTDGEGNQGRQRWMTVAATAATHASSTNEQE